MCSKLHQIKSPNWRASQKKTKDKGIVNILSPFTFTLDCYTGLFLWLSTILIYVPAPFKTSEYSFRIKVNFFQIKALRLLTIEMENSLRFHQNHDSLFKKTQFHQRQPRFCLIGKIVGKLNLHESKGNCRINHVTSWYKYVRNECKIL